MHRLTPRRQFLLQTAALGLTAMGGTSVFAAGKATSQRIVSVGSAVTETIYALGAEKQLVGVDTTSLYPAAATKLPQVGYARTLAAEGILALAPTLVLTTEEAGPPATLRQISQAGIRTETLRSGFRFEGIVERTTTLGDLLGHQQQAAQLVAAMQSQWQQVRATIDGRTRTKPRILFVLSHSPNQTMVAGTHNGADAMINYVGGINAIDGFQNYKPLTPEAVIGAQPDVVLFTDQGLQAIGGIDGALRLPGIARTPAGQKRRIASMEAVLLLGFGTRLPEAVATLDATITKALAQ
jgi:iron complex transport system substrate-binding protein